LIPTLQLGQFGRSQGSGLGYVAPYDPYYGSAGLSTAVACRNVFSAYTGPIMRVRRGSDNAEIDLYPRSSGALIGIIDSTATKAWRDAAGAATLYVVRAYDQSGNGNDFYESDTAKQPTVFTHGSFLTAHAFTCDGTNRSIGALNDSIVSAAKSFLFMAGDAGSTQPDTLVEYGPGQNIGSVAGQYYQWTGCSGGNSDTTHYIGNSSGGANYSQCNHAFGYNGATGVAIVPSLGQTISAVKTVYKDGSARTPFNSVVSGAGSTTGNFPAAKWRVGGRSNGNGSLSIVVAFLGWDDDKTSILQAASAVSVIASD
jgi:hypothetical protein